MQLQFQQHIILLRSYCCRNFLKMKSLGMATILVVVIAEALSLPLNRDVTEIAGVRNRVARETDLKGAGTFGGLGVYQSPFGYNGLSGYGGGYNSLGYGGAGLGGFGGYGGYGGYGGGVGGYGGGGLGGLGYGGLGGGYSGIYSGGYNGLGLGGVGGGIGYGGYPQFGGLGGGFGFAG